VYLRFQGGKGVATSAGVLIGIAWISAVIGIATWALVFLTTRFVSVASMAAAAVIAVSAWFLPWKTPWLIPACLTVLGLLAVWRHRTNLQRLFKGTEHRFQFGGKK
jgi:glycerol-3-phosphate acyltransferase PlsY